MNDGVQDWLVNWKYQQEQLIKQSTEEKRDEQKPVQEVSKEHGFFQRCFLALFRLWK